MVIEFVSITQAIINESSVALLAEATYDESILGSESPWVVLPYLAKPYECTITCTKSFDDLELLYTEAIKGSSIATAALKAIVQLSELGKKVVIGCYAYDAGQSHLPLLMDIIEEQFVDNTPEMALIGG